jgi:hypothetical protein
VVFSNGIIGLAALAVLVIIVFQAGNPHDPLCRGVFCSFTLSQSGMVVHWFRVKKPRWRTKAVMNASRLLTGRCLWSYSPSSSGAYVVLAAALG